ncbi:MAG: LamG domain-containing protein, partial [Pirellulales bacterium]
WTSLGRIDTTPDVRYRRAWSMAVYQGQLFVGTLPSGRVQSIEAGKVVTYDRELAPGWRHVAAVKERNRLKLYVHGELVAWSSRLNAMDFNLDNDRPLLIGFGQHDYFNGRLSDVRLYRRAVTKEEIAQIMASIKGHQP